MSRRGLFMVTSVAEAGAGLALLLSPAALSALLLGPLAGAPVSTTIGRVAGASLIALSMACWLARDDAASSAASGVLAAIFLYNIAIVGLLGHARLVDGLSGVGLVPAVLIHSAIAVWCAASLRPANTRLNRPMKG
jgi:hypothetical protein